MMMLRGAALPLKALLLLLALLACPVRYALELEIGAEVPLAEGSQVGGPQLAYGGDCYLLVWQEGWPGLGASADIKALRLNPQSLQPLDQAPLAVCAAPEAQESPAVAYADGHFLVVWQDFRNGKDYDLRGVLLSAQTGQPAGAELEIACRAGTQAKPSVSASGKAFLVAWQEIAARDAYAISATAFSSAGKPLNLPPLKVAAQGASPAVGASGDKFLVLWSAGRGSNGALVDPAGGKVTPTSGKKPGGGGVNPACPESIEVAGNGKGDFMSVSSREGYPNPWGWPGPGAVLWSRVLQDGSAPEDKLDYGYRLNHVCGRKVPNVVDTATWGKLDTWQAGAPGGFKGTADGLWPNGMPKVVFDGQGNYLFVWVKGKIAPDRLNLSNLDLWVKGVDEKSLQASLADRIVAGDEGTDETRPALVPGPQGQLLLGYLKVAPPTRRICLRRLLLKN